MTTPIAKPMPDYAKTATIYQIFLRSFTREGTLRAAEKMVPHVASLGVDIIYLCPVVEADDDMDKEHWSERQNQSGLGNPKNPYRMKDFFRIDPEYGDDHDLKCFVEACHRHGMRVILDLVYYHCGPKAVFIEEHPDFVIRDEAGEIAFGEWHFPLLNFESAGLREYLWQNMEHFVREFDVDGYRCDVSGRIPLDFWEEGRSRIEAIKPEVFMLAETGGCIEEQVKAFDSSYGFTVLYGVLELLEKKHDAAALRVRMDKYRAHMAGGRYLSGFDSHDIASDHFDKRAEAIVPIEATNAALALCFCKEGIPFLYNGQEVADANRHRLWANRDHGAGMTVDWHNGLTEVGQKRMALIKTLTALRHSHPALAEGSAFSWIENDCPQTVLSFVRESSNETLVAVFHFGDTSCLARLQTGLALTGAQTLLSYGATVRAVEGESQIELLTYGYWIGKIV